MQADAPEFYGRFVAALLPCMPVSFGQLVYTGAQLVGKHPASSTCAVGGNVTLDGLKDSVLRLPVSVGDQGGTVHALLEAAVQQRGGRACACVLVPGFSACPPALVAIAPNRLLDSGGRANGRVHVDRVLLLHGEKYRFHAAVVQIGGDGTGHCYGFVPGPSLAAAGAAAGEHGWGAGLR